MTKYVQSIDPGLSTGIALLGYDEQSVWLEKTWQFGGGIAGVKTWAREYWDGDTWDGYNDAPNVRGFYSWKMGVEDRLEVDPHDEYNYEAADDDDYAIEVPGNTVVIAEKFTARNTRGFSYTTASLEPLRCEGALIALGLMPDYDVKEKRWRDPGLQYLVGGKDKADKKKRQHAFLKDSGFYVTGKMLDAPNADDARSAIAHGLNYLSREKNHEPSFRLMTDWSEAYG